MTVAVHTQVHGVAQLASRIRGKLRELGSGWVEGEVQKIQASPAGHVYLTLADAEATIAAVVWRGDRARVGELPRTGALVQAHYARVDFYGPGGRTQLHVDRLRLTGEGELLRRKAATLARLRADGLCEPSRRRSLPRFPRRVGVISGRDSDAKTDVERALRERFPPVHVVHRAALVQGATAVDSIIDALGHLQGQDALDVIILARGGGSVADLLAFDDERLCRAISACAVPVVTSIGHSKQRPNCDAVAAACADVPGRAAERVLPSAHDLLMQVGRVGERLDDVPRELVRLRAALGQRLPDPRRVVVSRAEAVLVQAGRMRRAPASLVTRARELERLALDVERRRGLVPRPEALRHEAVRLEIAARRFFRDREGVLEGEARRLTFARARVPLPEALDPAARRRDLVARRQLGEARNWARALERHATQRARAAARRVRLTEQEVARAGQPLPGGVARALSRTRRDVEHHARLVEARDFRSRGWALVADAAGRPVRSASRLEREAELRLRLADGEVGATVHTIHLDHGDAP